MALTEFDRSANSRCAIITLHRVLPARPLPLKNFEQALGSLSERVERGPELIQPRVKVVQVSGARGRRYRENAGGWSRGAGLRTVIESLYGVAMRIRLKTIEAPSGVAGAISGEAMCPEPRACVCRKGTAPGLANDSRHGSTRQTRRTALALANITPPGDDHLRPSISCSLPDAAAFWVSSLPPRWTPPMKTLGTCLGPG